jgi:hypothetical protein
MMGALSNEQYEREKTEKIIVPKVFQADKEVGLAACQENGWELEHTTAELQADKEVVLAAVQQDGWALKYASAELKADKEIVLAACRQNRWALEYASAELQADREVVLAAVQQYGWALQFASAELRSDREVVSEACRQNMWALEYAGTETKAAFQHEGCPLACVPPELRADREFVLAACYQNGRLLEYASVELQADKEVVMAAASSYPDALKYAKGGLGQDKECLVAAKVWDRSYEPSSPFVSKIVLSTRFSLEGGYSRSQATTFAVMLKENDYIRNGNFSVYSPNAFAKDTCDPEWTRASWPCRGTFDTCRKEDTLKKVVPQTASCWRYSFRHQLEEAKRTDGCMIQLVERVEDGTPQFLGKGLEIEAEMAIDVGTKVFRVYGPTRCYDEDKIDFPFKKVHMRVVVSRLRAWYEDNCSDLSDCVIRLDGDV